MAMDSWGARLYWASDYLWLRDEAIGSWRGHISFQKLAGIGNAVRALAIAFFYAIGTGIGGVAGPWLFGLLIDTGSRLSVLGGYLFGAALMIAAAIVAGRWAVAAERKPLESVARPLAARD